jgi:hypothetical protein
MICSAVHLAVGLAVTLKCTTRRRRCRNTNKANRKPKVTAGTTKKSIEARQPRWLSKKVRHICDGGRLRLGM